MNNSDNNKKTRIDLDLRIFRRYPQEIEFTLFIEDRPFNAKTIDYSLSSLGITIEGSPRVKPGDILPLKIDELNIHQKGRVLWTKKTKSALRAGILKIGPLKGSFTHYKLSDILIGLQRTLKTGILNIWQGSICKKIYIKNGTMIFLNQIRARISSVRCF